MRIGRLVTTMLVLASAAQLPACSSGAPATGPSGSVPPTAASAHATSGSLLGGISGTVYVSGGPVTPRRSGPRPAGRARVQLVDAVTGLAVTTATTNTEGHYVMSARSARYRLVTLGGFSGCASGDVTLASQTVLTQDIICAIR